jgi:tetratricopeptide (TPR) repeat protein
MSKENLLYGVIGIMIGAIIGFTFANSVNKNVVTPTPATTAGANAAGPLSGNPALPADHPPLGTSPGTTQPQGGAIPEVTAAIDKAKADPQNFEAQMTAGDLYYQIQRFEDAAKFYETAHKLKSADIEPMVKLGNALFDGEKYAEAEKWYTLALEKNPKDITVRTDLGLTFFLREPRDIPRAIKEYEKSLAINPDHEITLQNLVVAYREMGDAANLEKATAKLKTVNPNNPALKN